MTFLATVSGIDGEAALEVRVHGKAHRTGDRTKMLERVVEPELIVGPTERPGSTRARRCERLEAQLFEGTRAASVPRVRHHETAGGVQPTKCINAIIVRGHGTPRRLGSDPTRYPVLLYRGSRRSTRQRAMVLVMEFSDYVLRHLPPPPLRVLEVGCGDQGGVTPALVAAGYDVLAIDPRAPEGPNYRRITLEELEPEPFDAVVAGRVLHHVTPLAPALAKLAHLAPLLLADEFAWNLIDADAQRWYERLYQQLREAGRSPTGPEDLDQWRWRHADLHSSETLCSALDAVYETVELEWRPYLYHWLGQETEAEERAAIDAGELPAIGYRVTCQTRSAEPGVAGRETEL